MRSSIYARSALVLLGVLAVTGIVGIVGTLVTTRRHAEEVEQKLNRELAAHLVDDTTILQDGQVQQEGLEHLFHMLMVINPRIELYLLDPQGRIISFSAAEGKVKLETVSLEPVHRFLDGEVRYPLRGDDPRHPDLQKVFSASPVPREGPLQGYLYVVLSGEQYDSVVAMVRSSYVLRISLSVAAAILLVVAAAGLMMFRGVTGRLRDLDRRIRAYGELELPDSTTDPSPDSIADTKTGDEVDRLDRSFDRMRGRIEQQVEALRGADAHRRELVANVSHDLRTPLASLQGYLETLLLRKTDLDDEEAKAYLQIAYRHSEKLGRLVDELFELAKLDSGERELRVEPFSAAELVQDIVEKFRLRADEHGIELAAELRRDLPVVHADIELIERAIDNLLDNALRHTPRGGRVTVGLADKSDGTEVCVSDTGAGIDPADVPRIFDRFYRGRGDSQGSGLGLAIARRILELHGGSITVDSVVGSGTSMTFLLAGRPESSAESVNHPA